MISDTAHLIKINDKVNIDLKIINNFLNKKIKNIESIILVGSFGRDEGSVLVVNNKIHSINDYDLVVVINNRSDYPDVDKLRIELAMILNIRQIDISFYLKSKLSKIKFSMFSYDLKYASKIIYGNQKILDLIPKMKSSKMPFIEGVRPLFLFLSSLLHAYPINKQIDKNQLFWNYQQLSKSILGFSTAMLIFDKKYHYSYLKRQLIFKETYDDIELYNMVKWATQFKLEPNESLLLNNENYVLFWQNVCNTYLIVMKNCLEKYYNKNFKSWFAIISQYKFDKINILKYVYSFLFNQKKYSDSIHINIVEFLLCVILNGVNDKKHKNLLKYEYNKISNVVKIDSSFNIENLVEKILKRDPNSSIFIINRENAKIF